MIYTYYFLSTDCMAIERKKEEEEEPFSIFLSCNSEEKKGGKRKKKTLSGVKGNCLTQFSQKPYNICQIMKKKNQSRGKNSFVVSVE